jgi:hypothetical protein
MALADMARGNGKAAVRGKVALLGLASRRFTQRSCAPSGCAVIDQAGVRDAAKECNSMVVAHHKGLHGLGDGACPLQQTAVAQAQHKEAPPSWGLPHRDGATDAPIDLGPLARGKG